MDFFISDITNTEIWLVREKSICYEFPSVMTSKKQVAILIYSTEY